MAFKADYGSSTVLEELRVASKSRFLATRPLATVVRRRIPNSELPRPSAGNKPQDQELSPAPKNSKFEIRNLSGSAFLIPNS